MLHMKTEKLKDFFENEEFKVSLFKNNNVQCAEIETWTKGGVNMIFNLEPFTKEEFIKHVNEYFDIDSEIDLHRQGESYKKAFTIRQSVNDFTDFENRLNDIVLKLS